MTVLTSLSLATALCCTTAWAADPTPLNVKTGQWESTFTSESAGQLPIPQEMLDKLTPEQRAKMEAMMKARSAQGARTNTYKTCLKKEDLDKPFGTDEQRKSCKQTFVISSGSRQEINMECELAGGKQTGTLKLEALDSGTVKGTMQMVASNGGRSMTVNSSFSSKWLGPVCTESK
jgi:Protein of unknown function (DUF3617)